MTEPMLKEEMTGLEIKIELMKKGIKLADIADMAGVDRSTVTRTLQYNDGYECVPVTEQIRLVLGLKKLRILKRPQLPKSRIYRDVAR
jgi:transcriptional regulator with XRE-family HTH domain